MGTDSMQPHTSQPSYNQTAPAQPGWATTAQKGESLDISSQKPFSSGGSAEFVLKRIRDIPALPEVVNRIIQLLGQNSTPASEIARLISMDPGLTSRVLRMVNSAAYGVPRQISSIQHGIMILGFNTVRGLVLSASIFKLFNPTDQILHGVYKLDHREFWRHSMITAIVSKAVAKVCQRPEVADDAFSAGMLHDIGKVVLDTYFSKDYQNVLKLADMQEMPPHGAKYFLLEEEVLGSSHAEIGAVVAEKWRLPNNLIEVIRFHHEPNRSLHSQTLVYTVALGNRIANMVDQNEGLVQLHMIHEVVCEYFDLDEEKLARILELVEPEMEGIEEMLTSFETAQAEGAEESSGAGGEGGGGSRQLM